LKQAVAVTKKTNIEPGLQKPELTSKMSNRPGEQWEIALRKAKQRAKAWAMAVSQGT
jgi:hypothetical protein